MNLSLEIFAIFRLKLFPLTLQAAYSVTDLLDELDSGEEEKTQDHCLTSEHTLDSVENEIDETMDSNSNVINLTDKENNSCPTAPSNDNLPESENILQSLVVEEAEVPDNASIKDNDTAAIEENDLYESADKVIPEARPDSISSTEDESSGTGDNGVWKRKKVVKKRKFKSDRRDPGYETIDVKMQQSRSLREKRVGYENVDINNFSENGNKLPPYSQVTRQRITSDISGRMLIAEGSQYEDTDEYSKKVQTMERSTDTLRRSSEAIEAEKSREEVVVLEDEQAENSDGCWKEDDDEIYGDTIVEPSQSIRPNDTSEEQPTGNNYYLMF